MLDDLRFSFRALLRNPGYALGITIALGLGIGANALVYAVASAVFLRPLPFRDARALVKVNSTRRLANGITKDLSVTNRDFVVISQRNRTMSGIGAIIAQNVSITTSGPARVVAGGLVSASMFSVLGVPPVAGRAFDAGEDVANGAVAVISDRLRADLFPGRPGDAVGKRLTVDGTQRVVLGVMPTGFAPAMDSGDVWIPLGVNAANIPPGANRFIELVGRLRPNTSVDAARADIVRIAAELANEEPTTHREYGGNVTPLQEKVAGTARELTATLLAAVGFLLLLTVANVINLTLSRVARRREELSTRLALGASRLAILRQQLCESVLLGIAGGALGLALAAVFLSPLIALAANANPLLPLVRIDWRVCVLVALVSVLAGAAVAIGPALYGLRMAGGGALAGGGRRNFAGVSSRRARRLLMATQVATATVLLIGAVGMTLTLRRLATIDIGLRSSGVAVAGITLPAGRYPGQRERAAFSAALIERLREDGFRRVGLSTNRFIRDETTQTMVTMEGSRDDAARVGADLRRVDGDYFGVMHMQAQRGRLFTTTDRDSAPPVAIVSRAFVKQYLHDGEPIGQRIRRGVPTNPWLTIVGVVPDVMDRGVGVEVGPTLYVPYQQNSGDSFVLVLETDQPAAKVERAVRAAVASIDGDRALDRFVALPQLLSESVGQERFEAVVTGTLAVLAILLAATGIFGVTVFLVTERTREMAVRLALGANSSRVVRVVVLDDARWIASACVAGLLLTQALTKVAQHFAPQVTLPSGTMQAAIACGLLVTGMVASALPALRVRHISLSEVLRAG